MSTLLFESTTKQQLDALAADLPQSTLLTGADGAGLLTAAKYVAGANIAAIIQPTDKDGTVAPAGLIKLDAIHQLRQQARGRAAVRTIFIIDDADRMNHRAQNAFLKLLEEPTSHVHFILTSHKPHLLLATILSRVERFSIRPISLHQTRQLLKRIGVDDPRTEQQLLFLASGKPAALTRLARDPVNLERIGNIMRDAQQFIRESNYQRAAIAMRYTDRQAARQLLSYCLAIITHTLRRNPSHSLIYKSEHIVDAYERIAANGNVRLQLVALVLSMV